jgi:biotin synthase
MKETPPERISKINGALPRKIRASIGTAVALGLLERKVDVEPTTAYLMTYSEGKCTANCSFCPQARTSESKAELLSRVSWPAYPTQTVLQRLVQTSRGERVRRVCVQALNYHGVFADVCAFVKTLKVRVSVPVSVSCQPLTIGNLWLLAKAGVDRIGIALDAANECIFDRVKGTSAGGPYRWRDVHTLLRVAIGIFGEGSISTHFIVGLGETEREMVLAVQECVDMGILPALFAFTPVEGTALAAWSQPRVDVYRRVQLARYLVAKGIARVEDMRFNDEGRLVDFGALKIEILNAVDSGMPFLTSGCPDCNRPFYNEKPSGPFYNFPRSVRAEELKAIKKDLAL